MHWRLEMMGGVLHTFPHGYGEAPVAGLEGLRFCPLLLMPILEHGELE